jgi:hypothetical protein
MKALKVVSRAKSETTSKPAKSNTVRKARIGVESMNEFFARAKSHARRWNYSITMDLGSYPAINARSMPSSATVRATSTTVTR